MPIGAVVGATVVGEGVADGATAAGVAGLLQPISSVNATRMTRLSLYRLG